MAPGFWQTMIAIAEVRNRYYSEKESCKLKPIDPKLQLFCVATGIADEVVTTERSKDLKFDKGTIYIVYFHTNVHVHIEKMGNLSKSKIKSHIIYFVKTSCVHVRNLHLEANLHPGANLLQRICTTYKGGAN